MFSGRRLVVPGVAASLLVAGSTTTPALATTCATGKVCVYSAPGYAGTSVQFTPTSVPTSLPFEAHSAISNVASRVNITTASGSVVESLDPFENNSGWSTPGAVRGIISGNHSETFLLE
ncbi:peptidase inhibitor family I36 protein [Actinomadura hibisca]|uniref:peptidase inhibitor family I36 protein n=1 Tax=Actinomadura hibisca TaxID=68565 RepID=UPI000B03F703|nr:peptidase inhibitor family I36 protein [Actinomadura hibisca]